MEVGGRSLANPANGLAGETAPMSISGTVPFWLQGGQEGRIASAEVTFMLPRIVLIASFWMLSSLLSWQLRVSEGQSVIDD